MLSLSGTDAEKEMFVKINLNIPRIQQFGLSGPNPRW
jgi:hypothetical protein